MATSRQQYLNSHSSSCATPSSGSEKFAGLVNVRTLLLPLPAQQQQQQLLPQQQLLERHTAFK
jgi:hypothetical protein